MAASQARNSRGDHGTLHVGGANPEKAKALLAEAGLADGFETTFSFELSNAEIGEPVSLLVQEALGKIGVKVTINKVPGGQPDFTNWGYTARRTR